MRNGQLPEKIANTIVSDIILAGSLAPGDRLPTVRDLQKKFEVSTATVALAFDRLEKNGIIVRKHGSGCFLKRIPNHTAAKTKTCRRVGFIYPDYIIESMLRDILSGIQHICDIHQIKLSTHPVSSFEQEQAKATKLARSNMDALIIYPQPRTIKQFRSDYLASELTDFPVVLMDLAYPSQMRTNITFDNYRLGFNITLKLLDEGHRNIAFKKLKSQSKEVYYRSNNDRYQGYLDALQSKGTGPIPEFCWAEDISLDSKAEEQLSVDFLRDFAEKPVSRRPSAVISLEDQHAATLIRCARQVGIRVPEDLKVVGFDNNPSAHERAGIPFPTTRPDFFKLGDMAMDLAIREVHRPSSVPLNYVLPVELDWV